MSSNEDVFTPLELVEILSYLPHRYPFMLLDRVVAYDAGIQSLTAVKNVTFNEPYFTGHFPSQPIMPGVLIVEALAQATGVLGYLSSGLQPRGARADDTQPTSKYLLVGVDKARFRRQVVPGDQLELTVTLRTQKRDLWKFDAEARVGGVIVCNAELISAHKML